MVLVLCAAPLACKSSSDATGNRPGAGGASEGPDSNPEAGASIGGAAAAEGGQPGLGEGAAPGTGVDSGEPGSWDMSFWDDAVWQ
jgi:hypothetical protein